MNFPNRIDQLLRKYRDGLYTLRELLPMLVQSTPEGKEADLVKMLPLEVLEPFKQWVKDYPLEGGIKIRDSAEELSIAVIVTLKQTVVS
jgi:hypothetical protein